MNDHSEPTRDNQIWHARKLMREQGPRTLLNPHAYIGIECGCGTCFCCAARFVFNHDVRIAGVTTPEKANG